MLVMIEVRVSSVPSAVKRTWQSAGEKGETAEEQLQPGGAALGHSRICCVLSLMWSAI